MAPIQIENDKKEKSVSHLLDNQAETALSRAISQNRTQ
jgi:hypothetical protein